MPSGLIQILAYGAQDLFLTGIPEITFFKFLYKRYTNYAMEFIELNLDGNKNFGEEISCEIPKNGDLINDIILKVSLPSVSLSKTTSNEEIEQNYNNLTQSETLIKNFNNFIHFIYESIIIANNGLDNFNETFDNIYTSINTYLDSNKDFLLNKNIIGDDINNNFNITLHLLNIYNLNENQLIKKNKLKLLIESYINKSYNILKNLQDDYSTKKIIYENSLNNNYNFSWINTLGWNIVSKVELEIGGFVIDRSYNQYMFIWNQLFNTNFKKLDFNKLFSLSSSAYTYDNTTKNNFDIYIPIKLFFNKDYSLSLPIISIKHQVVIIKLNINTLSKLIYTDYTLNDIQSKIKISNIKLLTNFIYLDQDERLKFANSNHEYLIEQTNQIQYKNIKKNDIDLELNINNPTKYIIWTNQKESDINNYNIHNEYSSTLTYDLTDSYPNITSNKNNTILSSYLQLNGVDRSIPYDSIYYNYVVPYEHKLSSCNDGINIYSFSLNPNDLQPSGSCNFSKLNKKFLKITLNNDFLNRLSDDDYIISNVFSTNYNILKFRKGMASLAFSF
tara:strand:+ start:19310 stop:20989 length:1680 start_codon:yes stop_codon:yes gene_type:complete